MEAYLRSEEDAALLTRLAMAESRQSAADRVYVMWIVKLRTEIAYSVNVPTPGQKTSVQQEIFHPGQFTAIPEILKVTDPRAAALGDNPSVACGGQINGAIYPCNPSGRDGVQPDPDDPSAGALGEWIQTYNTAQTIVAVTSEQFPSVFPGDLRGYDGFLSADSSGGVQFYENGNRYFNTTSRDEDWLWSPLNSGS